MPTRPGILAVQPVLSIEGGIQAFAGLSVDQIRVTAIRPGPPPDTVASGTFTFSADADSISTNLPIDVLGNSELFDVIVELMSGNTVMFTGTQQITVQAVGTTRPPQGGAVPLTFIGPGSGIASINMAPRDSGVVQGGQVQFRAAPLDSGSAAVPQYYLSWSTSNPAHDINANGLLRAGNSRGTFWVFARTPTGIRDSTRLTVSPAASSMQIAGGNGQTGAPGSPLAQPLTVQIRAADNLGVAGLPVTFAAATGGGSVNPTVVATDSMGFASAAATLGAGTGAQTFTASAPGVATVTFNATASGGVTPTITLSLPGIVGVANGRTEPLGITLSAAAPAGGVTVTVVSDSTNYLTVAAPGTVAIAAGATTGSINITGHATNIGVAKLRVSAPGYRPDSTFVPVIPEIIQLPPTLSVGVSATAQMTVTLNFPAPAGGLAVSLVSSDPAIATVTPTLNFTAGATTMNATVTGVASGTVGITATAAGYLQGGSVVTVGGGGVPSSISKTAGDAQTAFINDTTAVRPQVRVLDAGGAPLSGVAVSFAVTSGGGSIAGSGSAVTNATGFATLNGQWRMGAVAGANALTATLPGFPGVTAAVFSATGQNPPPVIALSIFGSNVVGQARTGQLQVKLLQAAPAGGLTVTLTTRRAGLLRIGSYTSENGSASFASGDTLQSVTVFGDSLATGIDTVIATAPGYTPDTLAVPISINLISLPTTANVALSQNANIPVNLSVAAPAGGLKVAIASSNPSVVQVLTDTVTIAAGSQVGSATVRGVALGSATVTATNPNYAPDISTVGVTASLNITTTTVNLNASFGSNITIQLESGGLPVAAPSPVPVTLTARDPACVATPAATIAQGFVNTTVMLTYGGTATLACSTYVVASGPAGFVIDSVLANVTGQPIIGLPTMNLGSGLQRAVNVSLGASNHGGTTVTVTSPDPSVVRLSLDDVTPGTASVNLTYPVGQTNATMYVQAMEGRIADTIQLSATAAGFTSGSAPVRVWQAIIDLVGVPTTANTLSNPVNLYVRTWTPSSPTGTQSNNDALRAGHATVVARISVTDTTLGRLADTATAFTRGDTAYVSISAGQFNSATTIGTGGAQLQYQGAGVDTVRATAAGFRSVGTAINDVVTITAPTLSIGNQNLGSGLQRSINLGLSAAAPAGGVTVRIAPDQVGVVKFSASSNVAGTDTLLVTIPQGSSNVNFVMQALEGILADTISYTATAVAGFTAVTPDTADIRVWQGIIDLVGVPGTVNTLSGPNNLYVRTWTPSSPTGAQSNNDAVRAGGPTVLARISVTDSNVARLNDTATAFSRADTAYVTVAAEAFNSATSFATGGAQLQYLVSGVDTVRAVAAGFRSVGTALNDPVTVTAPALSISQMNLGSGLQRTISMSISSAAPAGGVTVRLAPDQVGIVKLSASPTTAGSDTLLLTIPQGSSFANYTVQALEGILADTVAITATAVAPGFTAVTPDTANVRVWQPVLDLVNIINNPTTLRANDVAFARIWTPSSPTGAQSNNDAVRAGGTGFTVSFASSQPTVAQLESQTQSGSPVTAIIAPLAFNTPTTLASGGVEVNYLSTGQTAVAASAPGARSVGVALTGDTITVSPPTVSINNTVVGLGLQQNAGLNLSAANHGGVTVVVKSSNPAVARIAPDAVTAGTDSIVFTLPNGQSNYTYYVSGIEGSGGGLVNITATVTGFTSGNATANVVSTVFDVVNVQTSSISAATTPNNAFYARTWSNGNPGGAPSLGNNQAVRIGAAPLTVTFTTSNPGVATLVTSAGPQGGTATAQILPGQFNSGTSVAAGGVAHDFLTAGTTTLTVSLPGFTWVNAPIVVNVGP